MHLPLGSLQLEFLLLLLFVVIFSIIAQRVHVPYPIVLVVAGLVLSFVPHMPAVALDPNVIFYVVLPLLLNWAAWHTSWLTLRRNAWSISVLAVGLVVFTVLGVAGIAPLLLPGFDWRTGLILGAVIAPTDAIAATSIARRVGLPRKLVDIIEGESLVNDASGLLAFQIGVAVLVAGRVPTVWESTGRFVYMAAAGIVIGLVVGYLVAQFERVTDDAQIVIAITVLVPYIAYVAAELAKGSGVLAVVTCGLLHSRRSEEQRSARVRLEAEAVWNTLAFIVNGLVFVLIGLQLRTVLRGVGEPNLGRLLLDALIFSGIVAVLRIAWVFPALSAEPFVARFFGRTVERVPSKSVLVIAWSSMRGVLALAAAMSLPLVLPDGQPFPRRNMIIFLTFGAILVSLVLKGLTLPLVIRRLGLAGVEQRATEEMKGRRAVLDAALAYLDLAHANGEVFDEHYDDLRRHYASRRAALNDEDADEHGTASEHVARYRELTRAMLQEERRTAVRLRNERQITDEVLRELLTELDLAETRLNLELSRM